MSTTDDDTERTVSHEVELVLLLSNPWPAQHELARARALMDLMLDWTSVFGMLLAHRTAGLAWRTCVDVGIRDGRDFKPWFILKQLEILYLAQHQLAVEQMTVAAALFEEFNRRELPWAVMKGAAVSLMGYRTLGMRLFGDNDVLIARSHIAEVTDVMRSSGYIQGRWNVNTERIEAASRSEVLLHPVTSHETFPYAKHPDNTTLLAEHLIDVHFSVDLLTNRLSDEAVRILLDRRVALTGPDGVQLWALHPEDMFMFVCIHFEREACNRREIEEVKDLALYKLVDLLALMGNPHHPIDLTTLARRALTLGFAREVYFGLTYLDALYPGRVPTDVLDALRTEPDSFLHQVRHNDVPIHTWKRPIIERFFDPLRRVEFLDG